MVDINAFEFDEDGMFCNNTNGTNRAYVSPPLTQPGRIMGTDWFVPSEWPLLSIHYPIETFQPARDFSFGI